jgi:two-component system CheB/CheR fusion protein
MIRGEDVKVDNDILLLDLTENTNIKLNPMKTDLCSWISSVIEEVQTKYNNAEKEVQIIFEIKQNEKASSLLPSHCFSSTSTFVLCDPVKSYQVLFNLFDNAIKFSKHQGIIICSIQYSGDPGNVIVSITDTGNGVDLPIKDSLFQRFTSMSPENGIGIGLSRKITEAHDGKI